MPGFLAELNWIDLLVALLLLFYALNGFQHGWLISSVELAGFALALFVGLSFYAQVGRLLVGWTPLPYSLSKPLAFLLLWGLSDLVYGVLVRSALRGQWARVRRPLLDRLLGLWPGAVRGILATAVLLTIAGAIPFPDPISSEFENSRAAQAVSPRASALASQVGQIFGDAVQETVGLLTVKPESDERISLQFRVQNSSFDRTAELRMLELVNQERAQAGLKMLQPDEMLRDVARQHSQDMFQRGYFSHLSPEGVSPFERMRRGGARFRAGGENLALAPTVDLAHKGLMNSPGHRQAILSPSYGRVGIGVADGGLHGKMFTQNFAD